MLKPHCENENTQLNRRFWDLNKSRKISLISGNNTIKTHKIQKNKHPSAFIFTLFRNKTMYNYIILGFNTGKLSANTKPIKWRLADFAFSRRD